MNISLKPNPGTPYGCILGCQTHYPHFDVVDPCVVLIKNVDLEFEKKFVSVSLTHRAYGEVRSGIMISNEENCLVFSLKECKEFVENIVQAMHVYQKVVNM